MARRVMSSCVDKQRVAQHCLETMFRSIVSRVFSAYRRRQRFN